MAKSAIAELARVIDFNRNELSPAKIERLIYSAIEEVINDKSKNPT